MYYWIVFFFLLFCCFGIYLYFHKKATFFQQSKIPYKKPWPIVGNLGPVLLKRMSYPQLLDKLYYLNSKAKYIGFFEFLTPVIIIRDPHIIKLTCIKNFDVFYNRRGLAEENQDPIIGKDIFSLKDEKWHQMRCLLSPSFSPGKFKMCYELITQKSQHLLEHVLKEGTFAINMKKLFEKFVTDIMFAHAYGIETNCIEDKGDSFYVEELQGMNVEKLEKLKFLLLQYPLIWKILGMSFLSKRTKNFFQNIVLSGIANKGKEKNYSGNIIHMMMNAPDTMEKLTIEEMTAQAFFFFIASVHTTTETLTYLCYDLATHLEVQERLQEEIDSIRNKYKDNSTCSKEKNSITKKITLNDINNLKFFDAVIRESMRLHTAIPFLERFCSQTFQLPPALPGLEPYVLKPGSLLIIPTEAIHHDSKYFEDPDKFNPDRFYNKNNKSVSNSYSFLPFGVGPRYCIANIFALQIVKIVMFCILSKCNVKLHSQTLSKLQMCKASVMNVIENEIMFSIEERLV